MYYLSQIGKELGAKPENEEVEILAQHPRWTELCEKYGKPTIQRATAEDIDVGNTLAARLMTFSLYRVKDDGAGREERTLVVPKTVSVYRLKSLVGPIFGLRTMRVRLILEGGETEFVGAESASDEDSGAEEAEGKEKKEERERGKWVSRDVEIVDSTREVGFWVEGKEARLRVEDRGPFRVKR